jgi:endonuclease-3
VTELRESKTAPVDVDGCEALGVSSPHDPKQFRFHTLVALMLSSQTKDKVVGDAIRSLQSHSPGGLSPSSVLEMGAEALDRHIHGCGFHNNKTKFITEAAKLCLDDYDGDIPRSAAGLMALPGVGPKSESQTWLRPETKSKSVFPSLHLPLFQLLYFNFTKLTRILPSHTAIPSYNTVAHIVTSVAWGDVTGIGVDTHMHRMFNDLSWVKTTTAEDTRIYLESWVPFEKWDKLNYLFVGFGEF